MPLGKNQKKILTVLNKKSSFLSIKEIESYADMYRTDIPIVLKSLYRRSLVNIKDFNNPDYIEAKELTKTITFEISEKGIQVLNFFDSKLINLGKNQKILLDFINQSQTTNLLEIQHYFEEQNINNQPSRLLYIIERLYQRKLISINGDLKLLSDLISKRAFCIDKITKYKITKEGNNIIENIKEYENRKIYIKKERKIKYNQLKQRIGVEYEKEKEKQK